MIRNKPVYPAIFFLLILFACSNEIRIGGDDDGGSQVTAPSYLRLALRCPPVPATIATRSNPTGGEPGDGSETALDNEYRIDNFLLLFYRADERSNAPATTPIDKIMYFEREADGKDTTLIAVNLPAGEYDLLVATNTGDIRSALRGKTLGGIRDFLITSAWQEEKGVCSRFVMTSDGHTSDRVTLCGNPKEQPAGVTVEVERLAARIDYRTTQTNYQITDPDYGTAGVSILGGIILNKMKAGSYFLKRVADANTDGKLLPSTPVEYLGDELPVTGGPQQNYVVDPWSFVKMTTDASTLYDNYYTSFGNTPADWEKVTTESIPSGDWQRLGYTMENTVSREYQTDAYTTLVVFRARYTPEGFSEGQTFYTCNGKLYASREEAAAAGNTWKMPVHEYPGGICYYTWRVRHSNDGNDATQGIMEYAIVRNNIYRLRISDIYALGGEVPFPDRDPKPTPPDEPDDPDKPVNPDEPDQPDIPDNPDEPDKPVDPDQPDVPEDPDPEPTTPKIKIEVSVETWTTEDPTDIYL
ncbi:Mfa1 family fimbria major subunit [Parabacteroides sp.]